LKKDQPILFYISHFRRQKNKFTFIIFKMLKYHLFRRKSRTNN